MHNLEGSYNFSGSFLFEDVKGESRGEVYCFQDGKVIGRIADNNRHSSDLSPNGWGKNKLLLGYLSPDLELQILKTPPFTWAVHDVYWKLRGEESKGDLSFSGNWRFYGVQGQMDANSLIPSLSLHTRYEIPEVGLLKIAVKDVPAKVFSDHLFKFTGNMHDSLMQIAASNCQSGEINLRKK